MAGTSPVGNPGRGGREFRHGPEVSAECKVADLPRSDISPHEDTPMQLSTWVAFGSTVDDKCLAQAAESAAE